jgi:hypothetical protein
MRWIALIIPPVRSTSNVIAIAIALSAMVLLSACASPVEGLWPPAAGSHARTVIVSLDTWHAMIAFPREQGTEDSALGSQHLYEEWGYAERAWYVEGKTGLTGILRALFWPTDGVVEVGRHDRVWADRTPQPPPSCSSFVRPIRVLSRETFIPSISYLPSVCGSCTARGRSAALGFLGL